MSRPPDSELPVIPAIINTHDMQPSRKSSYPLRNLGPCMNNIASITKCMKSTWVDILCPRCFLLLDIERDLLLDHHLYSSKCSPSPRLKLSAIPGYLKIPGLVCILIRTSSLDNETGRLGDEIKEFLTNLSSFISKQSFFSIQMPRGCKTKLCDVNDAYVAHLFEEGCVPYHPPPPPPPRNCKPLLANQNSELSISPTMTVASIAWELQKGCIVA